MQCPCSVAIAPCPHGVDWTASIPWIVAALVAALGWGFTHLLSEARERRKEVRVQIDKLFEQLYKIEQDSRAFHCATAFDAAKAGDIDSKIQILERSMNRVPIFLIDNLIPYIIRLRRAVTLKNFSLSEFVTQNQYSDILQDIFSASQEIEDELERQYAARYSSKFPYFRL
jgi:hypothetical protein